MDGGQGPQGPQGAPGVAGGRVEQILVQWTSGDFSSTGNQTAAYIAWQKAVVTQAAMKTLIAPSWAPHFVLTWQFGYTLQNIKNVWPMGVDYYDMANTALSGMQVIAAGASIKVSLHGMATGLAAGGNDLYEVYFTWHPVP